MTRAEFLLLAAQAARQFPFGADSARKEGVPRGTVTKQTFAASKIFPGTIRDYFVYAPAQYREEEPAAVMVLQDGAGFVNETGHSRVPIVFDNLIHEGAMPVTIGVFANPGVLPALDANAQQNRYNRSYEYDAVNDRYARFLIEELLPEVGKQYRLTANPDLRAIGGSSSGGICAFTAAWFRPDAFRRVLSYVGSFTNLRGGDVYANLIRKTEPRPLRVFLQDGSNDNDIYSGSWWQANQAVARSLEWAGYEVKFVTGTGVHSAEHGGTVLPDALRWLWRDWKTPLTPARTEGDRQFSTQILEPGARWELVSSGHQLTEGPAIGPDGSFYFTDFRRGTVNRVGPDGAVSVFLEKAGANGLMFGPDGRLYGCRNGIVAWDKDGREEVIATGMKANDLAINAKGEIWFSDPPARKIWFVDAQRKARVVHEGINFPNGVLLSPDHAILYIADYFTRWVWSFQVQADGSLAHGQPWVRLENPSDDWSALADGMTVDSEGYLYIATQFGVQIADQPGRVVAILDRPAPEALTNVCLAGNTLWATCGTSVYRRRLRRRGVLPWHPQKPPQPRL
jgi:sugar lactone lactonase YvrE/enterochelin esterase-like enzyme